jgi:hypothetical protein
MVVSGDDLIFGVQLDMDEVIKYIKNYTKKHHEPIYNKIQNDIKLNELLNDSITEKYEYFYNIIKSFNLSIELINPPCCLFTEDNTSDFSKVYLGVTLCSNDIISTSNTNVFNSFEEYFEFYSGRVQKSKLDFEVNKSKYIEDLQKILPNKMQPKFYSIPNDCYNCS